MASSSFSSSFSLLLLLLLRNKDLPHIFVTSSNTGMNEPTRWDTFANGGAKDRARLLSRILRIQPLAGLHCQRITPGQCSQEADASSTHGPFRHAARGSALNKLVFARLALYFPFTRKLSKRENSCFVLVMPLSIGRYRRPGVVRFTPLSYPRSYKDIRVVGLNLEDD